MKHVGVLVMPLFVAMLPGGAGGRIIDRIVAIVDSDVITYSELNQSLRQQPKMKEQLAAAEDDEKLMAKLRLQILEQLIAERLLAREITKRSIKATVLQIERAFELQIRANRTTRDKFIKALHLRGFTLSSYKKDLARRIERQLLLERLFMPKIKVTEEDVRNFYTQNVNAIQSSSIEYCVSHILLQTTADMGKEKVAKQKQTAEEVLKKVRSGMDFAALARQYSQDPSAPKGGSLGCFQKGVMVPAFEREVFKLGKGQISGVIKTRFGYHVAKMDDIKGSGVLPFDKARRAIRMRLINTQLERQVNRWVSDQKRKTHIQKKL